MKQPLLRRKNCPISFFGRLRVASAVSSTGSSAQTRNCGLYHGAPCRFLMDAMRLEQHPLAASSVPANCCKNPFKRQQTGRGFCHPNYDLGTNDKNKRTGAFRPLPGTATEAQAVAPHLFRLTGKTPQLIEAEAATEAAVDELRSPYMLLLSTHGFYSDHGSGALVNPLCAGDIALAGANNPRPDGSQGQRWH